MTPEPHDLALHTIEICAGVGMLGEGLRAGLAHLGIPLRTVCYLEREAYPAASLAARSEEGSLDGAPVWSDLLTFDARRWAGAVDGIVAGFPCQDLSLAGKRAGLDGKRSGLFFDILDFADDCEAWLLFLENVTGIATATATVVDEAEGALEERAAARVLGELADRGWHAEWLTLSASDVGASHGRERWFCFAWRDMGDTGLQHQQLQQRSERAEPAGTDGRLADPAQHGRREGRPQPAGQQGGSDAPERCGARADADSPRPQGGGNGSDTAGRQEPHGHAGLAGRGLFAPGPTSPRWPDILRDHPEHAPALEPDFRGVVDGVAFAMDQSRAQRLKCVGNGVVALCAATAFVVLARRAGLRAPQESRLT